MGAKVSAETKRALALVVRGWTVSDAARKAGVYWSTVTRAIERQRKAEKRGKNGKR